MTMRKKKIAIVSNLLLLIWFSLDMFGVKVGDKYLVEGALKEDGMFMLISIIVFFVFLFTDKIGKYIQLGWLAGWFILQFLAHEWYTIFGKGLMGSVEGKIAYFEDCIQLISIPGRYVPDLWHIVLHVLIIIAFIATLRVPNENEKINLRRSSENEKR
ncbi:hypothetical protein ACWOE5_03800 [Aerococcus sanguinicola]|nr:hypothetical protein [Aerococcus sanguinicola]